MICCFAKAATGGFVAALVTLPHQFWLLHDDGFSRQEWLQGSLLFIVTAAVIRAAAGTETLRNTLEDAGAQFDALDRGTESFAVCLLDTFGRIATWTDGGQRLFGWAAGDIVGRHFSALLAPSDSLFGNAADRLTAAQQEGCHQAYAWCIRQDGTRFHSDTSIARIGRSQIDRFQIGRGGQGRYRAAFTLVVNDITSDPAKADVIETRSALLRSILKTAPDGLVIVDRAGIIRAFSMTAERLLGYREAEVVGRSVKTLLAPEEREQLDRHVYADWEQGRLIECHGMRKDGSIFRQEIAVGEARIGQWSLFTCFLRDVTARQEAEARLHELQAELLHMARITAMDSLSASLAHELNQPLTTIATYMQTSSSLLAEDPAKNLPLISTAVFEAGQEALRAGAIIQRTRAFLSRRETERTITPVAPLLHDAARLTLGNAMLCGIQTTITLAPGTGAVMADRVQIQQVLVNLLRNARQAVAEPGGHIRLDAGPADGAVLFSVIDNGGGMDPAIGAKIFKPFSRSTSGGMGLGLSICKTIVEAHGGTIWHEPAPDGGTAFRFTIPTASEEAEEEGACPQREESTSSTTTSRYENL